MDRLKSRLRLRPGGNTREENEGVASSASAEKPTEAPVPGGESNNNTNNNTQQQTQQQQQRDAATPLAEWMPGDLFNGEFDEMMCSPSASAEVAKGNVQETGGTSEQVPHDPSVGAPEGSQRIFAMYEELDDALAVGLSDMRDGVQRLRLEVEEQRRKASEWDAKRARAEDEALEARLHMYVCRLQAILNSSTVC